MDINRKVTDYPDFDWFLYISIEKNQYHITQRKSPVKLTCPESLILAAWKTEDKTLISFVQ
jgi:hypothetical protein